MGFYENFPENVHQTTHFAVSISNKKLQQTLTQTLHNLNNETFCLEDVANPSIPQCTIIFEFGIAEGTSFNYLDNEETEKVLKVIRKKPLRVMDFFCAIRYYKRQKERKKPLKFDYYMLRFAFEKKSVEVQVFHERGPRHVSPREVIGFIAGKVNEALPRKGLKPIEVP